MADLRIKGLRKSFGSQAIVDGIDLEVGDGEFIALVGPSGCGKSTLLRLVAGLEDTDDGQIVVGGTEVQDLPPAERGVAMVFQSYALYPHMTVAQNMGFALEMAGLPKAEIARKVGVAAEILQLDKLLHRKPGALSGGQRQRVAIGRAIVRSPKVFLFDEPLSNLDAALRVQMRMELSRLHRELKTTMVYVTHDQVEAMTLGQRIAVLNAGKLEQVGPPLALFDTPASRFVAGFLGTPTMNFLPVSAVAGSDGRTTLKFGEAVVGHWQGAISRECELGVRPEDFAPCEQGSGLAVDVAGVENHGDSIIAQVRIAQTDRVVSVRLPAMRRDVAEGQRLWLMPDPNRIYLFSPDGQAYPRVPPLA
jgi:multiple sugar transport system ATP-binding protein